MERFEENQVVIYQNNDKVEIGLIKSLHEHGAFVYYHSGSTTALTSYEDIKPIINDYVIIHVNLGQ